MKKTNTIFTIVLFLLTVILAACNNLGYEIEQDYVKPVKQPITTNPLNQSTGSDSDQTSNIQSRSTDSEQTSNIKGSQIKEPSNNQDLASKETDKSGLSNDETNFYTVQVGAYISERRADRCVRRAQNSITLPVNSVKIGSLYKIRVGSFSSKTEAETVLEQLKALGFYDSFIPDKGK